MQWLINRSVIRMFWFTSLTTNIFRLSSIVYRLSSHSTPFFQDFAPLLKHGPSKICVFYILKRPLFVVDGILVGEDTYHGQS